MDAPIANQVSEFILTAIPHFSLPKVSEPFDSETHRSHLPPPNFHSK
jgi:hypothetical protein